MPLIKATDGRTREQEKSEGRVSRKFPLNELIVRLEWAPAPVP